MISEDQLNAALEAWEVARDRVRLEQTASATLAQSHNAPITSLRKHEHTWQRAEDELKIVSDGHRDALLNAWRDMDAKCKDYRELLTKFKAQK